MMWFFSDPHFGHANIIKYSNRPFKDTIEMDDAIIDNINDRVGVGDELYCLGDWCFSRDRKQYFQFAKSLRDDIKCKRVHLIYGNHDEPSLAPLFTTARDYTEVRVQDGGERKKIVLAHYAFKVWNKSHHGAWHLYGHSHGSLADDPNSLSFDCGVDCHDFKPLSFDDVKIIMSRKTWKPVDHHGARGFEQPGEQV